MMMDVSDITVQPPIYEDEPREEDDDQDTVMTEPNEGHHIERMPNKDTDNGRDPVWIQNGHEHHEQGTQAVESNEKKGNEKKGKAPEKGEIKEI